MKNSYKVKELKNGEYKEWILKKHYAKRQCSVSYCFGLVKDEKIIGICTFGFPPNYNYNQGKCVYNTYKCLTLELNRLVINTNKEKNLLSYFLSKSIKLLPKPTTLVSYADPNQNHSGYIYQATNWIYTGQSTPKKRYTFEDGSTFDIRRGIHTKGKIIKIEDLKPTHRYIYLNANKKDKKIMKNDLKLKIFEYPKGVNKNYECVDIDMFYQNTLFDF
tara:strand:+ start:461 stop:1114 length:654 start_codon:yes stop_codon:yes gene_type:complete